MGHMPWPERIVVDPEILAGKPVIRGNPPRGRVYSGIARIQPARARDSRELSQGHSGVILFRVHPAIPENLEPIVLSALRAEHSWVAHVSIVTKDGIEIIPASAP